MAKVTAPADDELLIASKMLLPALKNVSFTPPKLVMLLNPDRAWMLSARGPTTANEVPAVQYGCQMVYIQITRRIKTRAKGLVYQKRDVLDMLCNYVIVCYVSKS